MLVIQEKLGRVQVPTSYEVLTDADKKAVDTQIDDLIEQAYSKHKPFFIQDLVGKNQYPKGWNGTAIYNLYSYNLTRHKDSKKAIHFAGIDVGYLFKNRIALSKHCFRKEKGVKFGYTMNMYIPL